MELKIYKELKKSLRVHPEELHSYGVAVGLLDQADDNIVEARRDSCKQGYPFPTPILHTTYARPLSDHQGCGGSEGGGRASLTGSNKSTT